ncbi:MAG: hypothetical protein UY73_C0028G0003 [Parcubacteria group bacterium GW2011_GWA2_52_8]|nr:MAG: hypothetical protein UY73_C0028G0003 [Parcubacteria group bacterium GW2011_GWA2_52_8]
MLSGLVDWFDAELGQGFITDESGTGQRTYFTSSAVQSSTGKIRVGAKVTYELDLTTRNGPRAARVIVKEFKCTTK